MSGINTTVHHSLETYCELEVAPEYAVLVNGGWGSGKSHFVEQFIKEHNQHQFIFVSLYGIGSIDAIEDKFFQQLNPFLSSKSMVLAGKIGKGLLKGTIKLDLDDDGKADGSASVGVPNIKLSDYLTDTKNCILIFDDLERCSLGLNEILGYINYFVEKEGYKVIIIADENKLVSAENKDKQPYKIVKEKLIGKTLHLQSDVDVVYDIFVAQLVTTPELKELADKCKKGVINIFRESTYNNLRSLRKIFLEFNSIYKCLNSKVTKNQELMEQFLILYALLSMEVYSGSLDADSIDNLIGGNLFLSLSDEEAEEATDKHLKFSQKYDFDLSNTMIDVQDWKQWLQIGTFNYEKVNCALLNLLHLEESDSPEWKKLLRIYDLEHEEFKSLSVDVWSSFANCEISNVGAIKHIVSSFVYFAETNLIRKKVTTVIRESKRNVNKALKDNNLEIPDSLDPERDFDSFAGFTYISNGNPEFNDFCNYFDLEVSKYQGLNRKRKAPDLLDLMRNDLDKLSELLCDDASEGYTYKPILNILNLVDFIKVVEDLSNKNKRCLCSILRKRYKEQNIDAMKDEVKWMKGALSKIKSKHSKKRSIDSLVMVKFAEWIYPYVK
jgi:hypothetical protein